MGFFKNLFEKKTCDLCGGEIGLLGNRKLEDGNCCKECAKKLSPWFTERKHSTVEEIRQQIQSREENRKAVAAFQTTRSYGKNMMVYLDENARKLMVTDARDLEEANPDVLDFCQVTACDVNVVEAKNEVYHQVRDQEDKLKNESFSPRRYRYSYEFRMTIRLNHPYIDEINFSLSGGYFPVRASKPVITTGYLFGPASLTYGPDGSSSEPPSQADFQQNDDYVRYERWGREICEILLSREKRPSPAENLYTLVEECKALATAYKDSKSSGDTDKIMEARDRSTAQIQKLHNWFMYELRGEGSGDGDMLSGLVEDYKRIGPEVDAANASGDPDRIYAAMNSLEVILQQATALQRKDPVRFQESGFIDPLPANTRNTQDTPSPKKKVVCPYCGSEVEGGKFCGNCGAKLE